MLYLKACPRCRGDVHYAVDIDGPFLQCLQCGFAVTSADRGIVAKAKARDPAGPACGQTNLDVWARAIAAHTRHRPARPQDAGGRAALRLWQVIFLRDALAGLSERTRLPAATP